MNVQDTVELLEMIKSMKQDVINACVGNNNGPGGSALQAPIESSVAPSVAQQHQEARRQAKKIADALFSDDFLQKDVKKLMPYNDNAFQQDNSLQEKFILYPT